MVEGTPLAASFVLPCALRAPQGTVMPGLEQEAHFSWEEERKQLLLHRAPPGPEAVGPSLLLQLLTVEREDVLFGARGHRLLAGCRSQIYGLESTGIM